MYCLDWVIFSEQRWKVGTFVENKEMSQEKQAEFLAENIKLKNTLNVINNETLSFITRRQYISDYIRKYI